MRKTVKVRIYSRLADAWRNTDDCEPIPAWMNEVACWLSGGRFAVETRAGTVIVELGDWIVRDGKGVVGVWPDEAFCRIFTKAE